MNNVLPFCKPSYQSAFDSIRRMFMVFTLALCSIMLATNTVAQTKFPDSLDASFSQEPEFLDVEQAFVFDFNQKNKTLSLTFSIADGYYLYKKQFKYVAKDAEIGTASYPKGVMIEDEFFGESEVFYNSVVITLPIENASYDGIVKVRYLSLIHI